MNGRHNEPEDRGIYPQLSEAFRMTDEQKERIFARIQARTEQMHTETAVPAPQEPVRKQKPAAVWMRFLPLAACLMLAVGGGLLFYTMTRTGEDPLKQVSQIEHEIVPATTCTTTSGFTETTQTVTAVSASDSSATGTSSALQTGQTTAQTSQNTRTTTAAEPKNGGENHTGATAAPQKSSTSILTAASTTTTTQTSVTTTTTTEEPPVPQDAVLVMDSCTARAGETVTMRIRTVNQLSVSGLEMILNAKRSDGGTLDQADISCGIPGLGDQAVVGYIPDEQMFSLVFSQAAAIQVPAGSVISMLTFTVPEDMAPGTTFTFAEEELLILGKDYNMLPNCRYTSGTLTVTE